ncbi:RluA family pseudouridine synthase [Chitinophagaceae bacterium 26-R-25]|nr:RluA family pseudouridine synthase [Chitinophagaceae bacterium 26-R-25]
MKLEIIFENDNFIAVNKPSGLLSVPDRMQSEVSLKDILLDKYGQIFTVHRLDKDTSGVIVFAKNEQTHKHLSQQFEQRETEKFYVGLVLGRLSVPSGLIDMPIIEHPVKKGVMTTNRKGKASQTAYQVLQEFNNYSWMQFQIFTGRTHQIRVHMKHLGHAIVCDETYGDGHPVLLSAIKKKFKLGKDVLEEKPLLNRLALHAQKLVVKDEEGNEHVLEAAVPKDMRATLNQLEKWN